MFADVVGYTALAQKDETFALQVVSKIREWSMPVFDRHGGRLVKTMGDGFLVEFSSAMDAVLCGIELQHVMRKRPSDLQNSEVQIKVGIHVGDVIHENGDVLGDAVNIASRIEPLAGPGEVCISAEVMNQVKSRLSYAMIPMGPQKLKNVADSVETYRVLLPWAAGSTVPSQTVNRDLRRLVVLPLSSFSPEPNDEYFADGMTEEVITKLSGLTGLRVIARTSSMKYKGVRKSVLEIGTELRVGSVLEGSVRKSGERMRITLQLIDAATEEHLWANSYDRNLTDIFAVQGDIAQKVAEALSVKLLSGEKRDIEKEPTGDTEAYTIYLKGRYYMSERTRGSMDKAVKYFEEAIRRDPSFALAYAGLADCYIIYPNHGWLMPTECYPKAKAYALKAIEIDPRLAEPHSDLAYITASYEYKWQEAEAEFKRAMELKPSYATTYHWYSLILRHMGRFEESYEQIKRADELDPLSRTIGDNVAEVLFALGKLKRAIERSKKLIEANPDFAYAHRTLGWIYYSDSRLVEAEDEIRKALALSVGSPWYKADLACLLGFEGRRDEANKIIKEIEEFAKTTYVDKVLIAEALFAVGRIDEAFDYLERGYEEKTDVLLQSRWWPWLKDLRRDPRWASIGRRLGLLEN
jgi:TolB-like protein/Flp pilus assembly protein TadD